MYTEGLYIGLMSGTSVDGVDAALVDIQSDSTTLLGAITYKLPESLRSRLLQLNSQPLIKLSDISELDHLVARSFINASNELIQRCGADTNKIIAIGSHGQTIFHSPDTNPATTMQIGDNSLIATSLGIDTIGDFRRADMAAGGQGAPLMPAFHKAMFNTDKQRFVLNLGGIANITVLGKDSVTGFDTGPANTLLDAWIYKHQAKPCDCNGAWGRSGEINTDLLGTLLTDVFFAQQPPKSTGADYFNLAWLENKLPDNIEASSVQATLTELTACSVAQSIKNYSHEASAEVLVCGGGAHNRYLIERLEHHMPHHTIKPTSAYGVDADSIEAMGFAWLAYRHIKRLAGNLPSVTGAKYPVVLGGLFVGNNPERLV